MFIFEEIDYSEWKLNFKKCQNNNMLQCWQYGAAKEETGNWLPVRFLVKDEIGEVVGLIQFLTRKFPLIGRVARMNRGPILIEDVKTGTSETLVINIISALLKEFNKRRWRIVQIAPEINNSVKVHQALLNIGLHKLSQIPYASGLIDLRKNEQQLLMGLKKKWRYCLRKSLQSDLNINVSSGDNLELKTLLDKYTKLQERKDFSGIPNSLISSLAQQVAEEWDFVLFVAKNNDSSNLEDCLGMLVIIMHGDTATYLIGLTNNKGRCLNVNYALLWHAMLHAKSSGTKWFDIGGLDESTPDGIAHFKRGLNSSLYSLVGEWRYYSLPRIPIILNNRFKASKDSNVS